MKRVVALGLGLLALAAAHAVAQNKPAAVYYVAEFEMTDPVGYRKFGESIEPIIKSYGGKFVARRGKIVPWVGEAPKGITIIMFENLEKGQSWIQSPEAKALFALRDESSKGRRGYFVEAGNAPP